MSSSTAAATTSPPHKVVDDSTTENALVPGGMIAPVRERIASELRMSTDAEEATKTDSQEPPGQCKRNCFACCATLLSCGLGESLVGVFQGDEYHVQVRFCRFDCRQPLALALRPSNPRCLLQLF
jgi:hypothetical protein